MIPLLRYGSAPGNGEYCDNLDQVAANMSSSQRGDAAAGGEAPGSVRTFRMISVERRKSFSMACGNTPGEKLHRAATEGAIAGTPDEEKNQYRKIIRLLFYGISMIPVCCKNGDDACLPFMIFSMGYPVDMGEKVGIMPMGYLCAGTMGVLCCCMM
jgi:hypothetical protein